MKIICAQLQAQVGELQDRVESLAWDRKELQEHIRIAIKENELMEMMLVELEEEHDEALHKIKLLETEVYMVTLIVQFWY